MRTAISATITHDRETWKARVGERLTGHDHNGRPLSSRAIVIGIEPNLSILVTTGDASWEREAQVHGMSEVEWVDLETETSTRAGLDAAVSKRLAAGWAHHQTLDLSDEPEHVRVLFTRQLD